MRFWVGAAFSALCVSAAGPALAGQGDPQGGVQSDQPDLSELSIEQLAQIQVRSASKREEPLSAAPAALYVITPADIENSGAT